MTAPVPDPTVIAEIKACLMAREWFEEHPEDALAEVEHRLRKILSVVEEASGEGNDPGRVVSNDAGFRRPPLSDPTAAEAEALLGRGERIASSEEASDWIDEALPLIRALMKRVQAQDNEIKIRVEREAKHYKHEIPNSGEILYCLVCGYKKPWGIFDQGSGSTVCVECRDLGQHGQARIAALEATLARYQNLEQAFLDERQQAWDERDACRDRIAALEAELDIVYRWRGDDGYEGERPTPEEIAARVEQNRKEHNG